MNKKICHYLLSFSWLLISLLLPSYLSASEPVVKIAVSEQEPYIGENLPNFGYVNELVSTVFERVGYRTELEFFPLARAQILAEQGKYDAMMPFYFDEAQQENFSFSKPFPGNNLGLLKKKSMDLSASHTDPSGSVSLSDLKDYSFGLVRGTYVNSEFDNAVYLDKQLVVEELNMIDMLAASRFDFAVIDQYTASDLIINQRPHLLGKLEFVRPFLSSKPFHIAFSKRAENSDQLIRDFNRGLSAIESDGTLDQIVARHGLLHSSKKSKGKKQLTIGAIDTEEIRVMRALSAEFEKQNPDIVLEWRILDENTLRKRLLADIAISEGAFDIMMIGAYEAPIWGRNAWLKPITDLPQSYDLEDVSKSARDGLSYQEELYALPFYVESTMTFYRKDLFEQAGLVMPKTPTYEQIFDLASQVHDPENGIYGIGLRGKEGWGQNISFISTLVNTFGGRWFDENWKPRIYSEEWKQALSFYKEILEKYGHPEYTENGWYENQVLFAEGELAIVVDATSFSGRLYNPRNSKVFDKIGFACAPVGVFADGARWLWSWSLAVSSATRLPEEAQDFIVWATSKQYIKRVAETQGWIAVPPGSRLSTYGEEYRAAAPFADFVIQEIQRVDPKNFTKMEVPYTGPQFVDIPEFPAIGNQVGLKIVQYLRGEVTLDETLRASQELVESIMEKSGYYSSN